MVVGVDRNSQAEMAKQRRIGHRVAVGDAARSRQCVAGTKLLYETHLIVGSQDSRRINRRGERQGGNREATTSSKPRSNKREAKKSGDIVITADHSPRRRMSAHTSWMPVSHGLEANAVSTTAGVNSLQIWRSAAANPRVSISPAASRVSSATKSPTRVVPEQSASWLLSQRATSRPCRRCAGSPCIDYHRSTAPRLGNRIMTS